MSAGEISHIGVVKEITSDIGQINDAVQNVNHITQKNTQNIDILKTEIKNFEV